jgi:hypothetical protein
MEQPVGNVYVMVVVPGLLPVTTPLAEPIVAINGTLLTHVPPVVISVREVVLPTQTERVPPIAGGSALIVTTVVALQPVGSK